MASYGVCQRHKNTLDSLDFSRSTLSKLVLSHTMFTGLWSQIYLGKSLPLLQTFTGHICRVNLVGILEDLSTFVEPGSSQTN